MELTDQLHSAPADGELFLRPFDRAGKTLSDPYSIFVNPEAARRTASGLIVPPDVPQGYVPIGSNLVVDKARQTIAYLLGGGAAATQITDWVVAQVSFGVGDEVPRFTDTTLSPQPDPANGINGGENEIEITAGVKKKPILSVDWPQSYVIRWEILLTPDEANGNLIREMGLWTKNGNLFARKTFVGTNKTGDFGLSWLWRVRT